MFCFSSSGHIINIWRGLDNGTTPLGSTRSLDHPLIHATNAHLLEFHSSLIVTNLLSLCDHLTKTGQIMIENK